MKVIAKKSQKENLLVNYLNFAVVKRAIQIDLVDSIIKTNFKEDLRKGLMDARMGRLVDVAEDFKLTVH